MVGTQALEFGCESPDLLLYQYFTGCKKILSAMQETLFNPWVRRSPGEEYGNTLQYSCLENPMDRGAWGLTVQGVTKNWTQLSD